MTSQPYFNQATSNYYVGLKSNIPLSEPHFDGRLYTLIDGYCFSSCGHLAALIKYQNIGMMIGEETNGSYVCTDSSASYTLTNSRLSFRTSTAAWGVAVEGFELGRGVSPNIEISISFEDYLNGLDTALLYTIDLIESE
jgi:C-terminal processing protease CtpA/Prc